MSVCLIVAALLGQGPEPPHIQDVLGRMSEVRGVEIAVSSPGAAITLIHLRDWHYVPFDEFITDLEAGTTARQRHRSFRQFLRSVSAVQREQRAILRRLNEAGLQIIFLEGLTADDERIFPLVCRSLWKGEDRQQSPFHRFRDGPNPLSIRSPGQLLAESAPIKVRAADSSQTLFNCNPFDSEGTRREVTNEAKERREDHMVSRMLEAGSCVVVLGGAHDLSDNVKRLAGEKARLLVVTPNAYEAANLESNPPQANILPARGSLVSCSGPD